MSIDADRILNDLHNQLHSSVSGTEVDKAMADWMIRGAGYLKLTTDGVTHVPFDSVHERTSERTSDDL